MKQQSLQAFFPSPDSGRPSRKCKSKAPKYTDEAEETSVDEDTDDFADDAEVKKRSSKKAKKDRKTKDKTKKEQKKTSKKAAAKQTSKKGSAAADKAAKKAAKELKAALEEYLPVLTDPQAMFDDLVARHASCFPPEEGNFNTLGDVARYLGRPLRVATMCSGTESPLLALGMVGNAVEAQFGVKLEVEHVFSCEIEPFKQAYIERNFSPPVLFRDVCELGRDQAFTAFGALAEVPGHIDLLVAGTSCVDYSNLNNEKKDLAEHGESGMTFRGMLAWVRKHKPPLVLLENVCSAPWERVKGEFAKAGYDAEFMRLDTKRFYIPHTRTRVYLLATLNKHSALEVPGTWKKMMKAMERPSSSALDAFLLPSDDPRVHTARVNLARSRRTRGTVVDWGRCESRHQRARVEEALGSKRPFTKWGDGGICKMPDYAWNDWGLSQTERVLDLMDIEYLRLAKKGTDPMFKTLVWNLSQNVDRTAGTARPGICPCLTPSMVPFVTSRGGPLTGIEALSLQGIPVDDLLLTRESENNMADLAGNAMTTTVVGAAIVSALCLGMRTLSPAKGSAHSTTMADDGSVKAAEIAARICGEDSLNKKPLILTNMQAVSFSKLLLDSKRSSRRCMCEGRDGLSPHQIQECTACGHTACKACMGSPEHVFSAFKMERLPPRTFEKDLTAALPMRLLLRGLDPEVLAEMAPSPEPPVWSEWLDALASVNEARFHFKSLTRADAWVAVYETAIPGAKLELTLDTDAPYWRVSVSPPAKQGAVRDMLSRPVARMRVAAGKDILEGTWEVCAPLDTSFDVTLSGVGEPIDAWETRLGLHGDFEGKQQWATYEVSVDESASALLDADIKGKYNLLERCWAANGSLYKKVSADPGAEPVFLFLDPKSCGASGEDGFVFARDWKRLPVNTQRMIIARVDVAWRPRVLEASETIKGRVAGQWTRVPSAGFAVDNAEGSASFPSSGTVQQSAGCERAAAVLRCEVPLESPSQVWPRGQWGEIPLSKSKSTFESFAWFLGRVLLPSELTNWTSVSTENNDGQDTCEVCAPKLPDLQWSLAGGRRLEAREDTQQAGAYEQALKARPPIFSIQNRVDESDDGGSIGAVRIGVNVQSLVHRARASLPLKGDGLRYSWRLTEYVDKDVTLPPLSLTSNRNDEEAPQPPHFKKYPLRHEQLRSLTWMIQQETTTDPFIEEEVEEMVLRQLRWRAEGRAQIPVTVRGGVLADQVGYGKTAITVGLIAAAPPASLPAGEAVRALPVKATLIMAPPHLLKQWPREIEKFAGKAFKVITIKTVADLNRLSIKSVEEADIVVVASTVLRSDLYYKNMVAFAGSGALPTKEGRHFATAYKSTLEHIEERTMELMFDEDGVERVNDAIAQGAEDRAQQKVSTTDVPKRLIGKALTDAVESGNRLAPGKSPVKAKKKNTTTAKSKVIKKAKKSVKKKGASKRKSTSLSSKEVPKKANGKRPADSDLGPEPKIAKRSARRSSKPVRYAELSDSVGDEEDEIAEDSANDVVDEEDAEEEEESSSSIKKKPPKKKAKRGATKKSGGGSQQGASPEERDPWCLRSLRVKKDWRNMHCPPLEMFAWGRVVVDEFTYLNQRDLEVVKNLKATFRWCLSGTPPVSSFQDIKGVAAFLGVHLGVSEEKASKREQTKAEKFHHFREMRTGAWHLRRHQQAQSFLDRFVRQNVAEIDEIPREEKIERLKLTPAELAIYLELEHHLQAMEMKTKVKTVKGKRSIGDREKRLASILGASGSPEEALLKRCSHFDLVGSLESAIAACDAVVELREEQLENCKDDLAGRIADTQILLDELLAMDPSCEDDAFRRWKQDVENDGVGDDEALELVMEQIKATTKTPKTSKSKKRKKGKEDIEEEAPTKKKKKKARKFDDVKWDVREMTHVLRRLVKELVGRVRSLRYFLAVRDLQTQRIDHKCWSCGDEVATEDRAVLSTCGHAACATCLRDFADKQECPDKGCTAPSRPAAVVTAASLGTETTNKASSRYGSKLSAVVEAIRSIDAEDRVLVFIQFSDLMHKVAEALADAGINAKQLRGSVHQKTNALDQFQQEEFKPGDPQVLLLNLKDESASGANLTTANHAIFVHPMLTDTQHEYTSCETQAVGRVCRYGQVKKVFIWRFIAQNTVDADIYQDRVARHQEVSA